MKHNKEIFEELNSISPKLAEMEKQNLFTVPEGYFNEFEAKLLSEVHLLSFKKKSNKENKDLDNYFDGLPDLVISRIKNEENNIIPIQRYYKVFFQIAAVFTALIMMTYPILKSNMFINRAENINLDVAFQQISKSEIENYLDMNVSSISIEDLSSQMSNEQLKKVNITFASNSIEIEESSIDLTDVSIDDIENL
jgi:hypothetical protein